MMPVYTHPMRNIVPELGIQRQRKQVSPLCSRKSDNERPAALKYRCGADQGTKVEKLPEGVGMRLRKSLRKSTEPTLSS